MARPKTHRLISYSEAGKIKFKMLPFPHSSETNYRFFTNVQQPYKGLCLPVAYASVGNTCSRGLQGDVVYLS